MFLRREALSTVKRLLSKSELKIELQEYIKDITEETCKEIEKLENLDMREQITPESLTNRLKQYETATKTLFISLLHGCYWDNETHYLCWKRSLKRIGEILKIKDGYTIWLDLRNYQLLLLTYACGIGAVLSENYAIFNALIFNTYFKKRTSDIDSLGMSIYPATVLQIEQAKLLPGLNDKSLPFNHYIHNIVKSYSTELFISGKEFDEAFEKYEYLYALEFKVRRLCDKADNPWAPPGLYLYNSSNIVKQMEIEYKTLKEKWAPLKNGLFLANSNLLEKAMEYLLGLRKNIT